MILIPDVWWPTALLAFVLFVDAAMSVRPPKFISDCLDGVGFPRDWWWTLIVIKTLAVVGLIVGIWVPGVALSANVAVIIYFCSAAVAHLRARNTGQAFWMNCLGMLLLSVAVLVLSLIL
ncbi:DoxX family protein [Agreia sp. VKM Ac-1783]|uniref:DoxX family protein n=1 Tax=Agreia sp. VKM Ac-1783 TaxID=1938889 RepID=UPI000A2AAB7A|nr:DoxX family protein [Agreia sp. VKM Ac-1783]SMQ74891.1 DoxX-like family protein [Agreia sp. VKM Ac-1783]